jgi:hypothetical protein
VRVMNGGLYKWAGHIAHMGEGLHFGGNAERDICIFIKCNFGR